MPKNPKYSKKAKEQFIRLIEQHGGNIHRAVAAFKQKFTSFERKTWYNWLATDEWVKQAYDDYLNREIDEAEALHKLHRNGIPIRDEKGQIIGWTLKPSREAIEFFLKTRGRNRGYVDRTETIHSVGVSPETYDLPEPNYAKLEAYKQAEEAAIMDFLNGIAPKTATERLKQ